MRWPSMYQAMLAAGLPLLARHVTFVGRCSTMGMVGAPSIVGCSGGTVTVVRKISWDPFRVCVNMVGAYLKFHIHWLWIPELQSWEQSPWLHVKLNSVVMLFLSLPMVYSVWVYVGEWGQGVYAVDSRERERESVCVCACASIVCVRGLGEGGAEGLLCTFVRGISICMLFICVFVCTISCVTHAWHHTPNSNYQTTTLLNTEKADVHHVPMLAAHGTTPSVCLPMWHVCAQMSTCST